MSDDQTYLTATEILTRATSLLDLEESLTKAIHHNYQEATRLHETVTQPDGAPPLDVRRTLRAHSAASALVDHAGQLLRSQEQDLGVLTMSLGTHSAS